MAKKKKNNKNPVDRFMREGEDGFKATSRVHKSKKDYQRKYKKYQNEEDENEESLNDEVD